MILMVLQCCCKDSIFFCRMITLDDKETRNNCCKTDKFACMRELFEDMNERNARMRHPSPLLAIGETLHPYRGHTGFKQYNPNKPAKYGLLYRSLCDSLISYTYYSLPYAGKPEKAEGSTAKYYITGTDECSKYLNNELSVYCNVQGINIFMDRYSTSISLETLALKKNIAIVGTMKHDQKGIPKELKLVTDKEERSVMNVYNTKEKIMVVSYIDKKKSGRKNVIVLSTMHDNVKFTKDQRKKPSVHTMYVHVKRRRRYCRSFVNNTFNMNKI